MLIPFKVSATFVKRESVQSYEVREPDCCRPGPAVVTGVVPLLIINVSNVSHVLLASSMSAW